LKLFVQAPIGQQTGLAEVDVIPDYTVREIKQQVCTSFGVALATVALMRTTRPSRFILTDLIDMGIPILCSDMSNRRMSGSPTFSPH